MFISTGKSLFGNTGLIISLLILLVLVYLSYNKCYVNSIDGFDCLDPQSTDPLCIPSPSSTVANNLLTPPKNLRIQISGNSIVISFTIDTTISNIIPKSFIIVLAQYDNNKINTGNNKFYLSNESIINTNVSTQTDLVNNLCTIVDGLPYCKYIYNNIDINDKSGNPYYYKLGVSAIYNINDKSSNSSYITPYNISSNDKMFTLNSSVDSQNNQYQNFLEYQKSQQGQTNQSSISANTYGDTISTADGQYELIKSQLGNYPDNLLLESQTVDKGTLSDLVDKSMAQALLNIKLSTNTIPNTVPNTTTNTIDNTSTNSAGYTSY